MPPSAHHRPGPDSSPRPGAAAALALALALAVSLAVPACSSVTQSTKDAVGAATRATANATRATVDVTATATRATVDATKAGFVKTKDFLIPWGNDDPEVRRAIPMTPDGESAPAPAPAPAPTPAQTPPALAEAPEGGTAPDAAAQPVPEPAPEPTEAELAAAAAEEEARAQRAAVRRATLSPSDFGGAEPDRSGLWAVAGWQVEGEEAWLQRDEFGRVEKFLARGDVVATRNSEPSPTVISASSFSVLPEEGMLVTSCRSITQGGYEIRATAGSMQVAIRSDGAISIDGPSESRYVGEGG